MTPARGHRGLLGVVAMLAAFGLSPPPSPPPEPDIDLDEVAKVLDLLAAAGIASPDVLEAAGSPARFIVTARKCLAAQAFLASFGEPGVTDVGRLLAPRSGAGVADMHRDRDEARRGATAADIESDEAYLARARASVQPKATTGAAGQVTEEQARRDPDAFARYVMSDHQPAMTSRPHGPVDFKRAGELSRAAASTLKPLAQPPTPAGLVQYEAGWTITVTEEPDGFAARLTDTATGKPKPMDCFERKHFGDLHFSGWATPDEVFAAARGWATKHPTRSAKPKIPRGDHRDEQAADRKARARKKARRGW